MKRIPTVLNMSTAFLCSGHNVIRFERSSDALWDGVIPSVSTGAEVTLWSKKSPLMLVTEKFSLSGSYRKFSFGFSVQCQLISVKGVLVEDMAHRLEDSYGIPEGDTGGSYKIIKRQNPGRLAI